MTAGHRRSTKLRGGWETTTPQAAKVNPKAADLPTGRRLVRQRLERFGLELPVLLQQNLNFAFCLFQLFSHAEESCMPSSNSVSDFSKGTSPFSSS